MSLKVFRFYISVFFLFVFCAAVSAAVTFEATRSNGDFAQLGVRPTALTISQHPVGNNANRALYVGISTYSIVTNPVAQRVIRVTFGPQASCPLLDQTCDFTRIGTQGSPVTDPSSAVEMFVLLSPPNDTRDIEITLQPLTVDYVYAGSISFYGVSQAIPPFFSDRGTYDGTNSNTGPTVTASGGVSGDIVLDTMAINFNSLTASPAAGQTERWNGINLFGSSTVGGGSTKPVPATAPFDVNMRWLPNGFTGGWAIGAILVRQFVISASPSSVSGRVVTQSGRGISKAFVKLTNNAGETRRVLTNPFGYFRFNDVPSSETYIISVLSKRYSFTSQVVSVTNDVNELIFTAQP